MDKIGYIVADVEKTCWDSRDPEELHTRQQEITEIIEIGAVWVTPDFKIDWANPFQTCVRPAAHQTLSAFCRELTQITQGEVDEAPSFPKAMRMFEQWMADRMGVTLDEIDMLPPLLCGWGSAEKTAFTTDCERHELRYPFAEEYVNLKERHMRWRRDRGLGRKRYGLARAVEEMGFEFEGQQHRALPDAVMAARIMAAIHDPEHITLEAGLVLEIMQKRAPGEANLADVRQAIRQNPHLSQRIRRGAIKGWWQPVLIELSNMGLIEDRGNGQWALRSS